MRDEQQERAPSSLLPTLMGRLGLPTTQHVAEPTLLHTHIDRLQKQASLEMLLAALDDKDETVRATAIRVLEQWEEQVPHERIVTCLHDDSWLVREATVLTLNAWGEPIDSALLDTDENPYVRETTHLYTQRSEETHFSAYTLSRLLFQSLQRAKEGRRIMREIQNGETKQDESDEIVFTNLNDETITSTAYQRRTRKKSQKFLRVTEGIVAALVIIGLVGTWFTFVQHTRPTSTGHVQNTTPITSHVLLSQRFQSPIATPAWSADGKYMIAVDSTNQVYAWDITTKVLRKTFVLPFKPSDVGGTWEWSFAPDARYLVVASQQGEIQVWDTVAGRMTFKENTHVGTWPTWAWSTDYSSRIIIGSFNGSGTAQIWYANSGERSVTLRDESLKNVRYFAWSPDGHYIALFTAASSPTQPVINGMVQIWDANTGKETQQLSDGGDTGTILWSPDSTLILTASNKFSKNTTIRVWDALTFTAHSRGTYTEHSAVPQPLQWSNDGMIVSTSAHETLIWNVDTKETTIKIPQSLSTLQSLSLSNSSLLEVVTQDGTLQIWATGTGRLLYTYKHATDGVNGASEAWSPDGKYVGFATTPSHVQVLDGLTGIVHSVHSVYDDKPFFGSVQNIVWSFDSSILLISNDRMIQVLQLSD